MTLPAWMYTNPEDIADRLLDQRARLERAAREAMERELRNKRRRIRRLVKHAMREDAAR